MQVTRNSLQCHFSKSAEKHKTADITLQCQKNHRENALWFLNHLRDQVVPVNANCTLYLFLLRERILLSPNPSYWPFTWTNSSINIWIIFFSLISVGGKENPNTITLPLTVKVNICSNTVLQAEDRMSAFVVKMDLENIFEARNLVEIQKLPKKSDV